MFAAADPKCQMVQTGQNLAPDFGNDVAVLLSRMPPEEAESVRFDFYRSPAEHVYGLQYVTAHRGVLSA